MKSLFGVRDDATMIWRSSQFAVRLAALVMASVAFAAVLFSTEPAGPGLQESSGFYLGAAEALAAGHGLRVPTASWASSDSVSALTRYPPGFPVAVALPVALGLPPVQAARLVEALAAFVAMAVLLAVVGDAVGAGAALLLGAALLVTPAMVTVHLSVLSEPLFLACVALTLATMVAMPEHPLAAGICAAAALAVRWLGIGVVLGVVVWAGIGRAAPGGGGRWRRALAAAAPALVGGAAAGAGVHGLGAAVVRRIGAYNGLAGALAGAGRTIVDWLAPAAQPALWQPWVASLVALGVIGMTIVGGRRVDRLWRLLPRDLPVQSSTTVPQLVAGRTMAGAALLAGAYAAALVAARLFADGYASFDDRLLSPLIMLVAVAFAVAAANWWRSARRMPRAALGVALLAWGLAAGAAARYRVRDALENGLDYGHQAWRGSAMLDWARSEGVRHALYSNRPMFGYLSLDRPVRGLPPAGDTAALRAFAAALAAHGGAVLAFGAGDPRFVDAEALTRLPGVRVLAAYPSGRVLAAGPP